MIENLSWLSQKQSNRPPLTSYRLLRKQVSQRTRT